MRNRAKCKKCNDIIESFHRHDYVKCSCGEIAVDGGQDYFKCVAGEFSNFIRIDDNDNEVPVKVKESEKPIIPEEKPPESIPKPTAEELIKILDDMIEKIEELPQAAMITMINHYDYLSLLMMISQIFKSLRNP